MGRAAISYRFFFLNSLDHSHATAVGMSGRATCPGTLPAPPPILEQRTHHK